MKYRYKEKKEKDWTRWFAFFPVYIGKLPPEDGQLKVWWEWVERKGTGWSCGDSGGVSYEYRLLEEKELDNNEETKKST